MTPFDFINAISQTKEQLIVDDLTEKEYKPYIINLGLSMNMDTVLQANEMNIHNFLDNNLQFSFLLNTISKKKRFNKWVKSAKIDDLEYVKEYFRYSDEKAKQALKILTDENIKTIKEKLEKGGKK
jgi:1-deoxy-D-xylulose 5-phosphate reductoisomerase